MDVRAQRMRVIMLAAPNNAADKILGIDMDADDDITKPFDPKAVTTRMQTVLRPIRSFVPLNVQRARQRCRLDSTSAGVYDQTSKRDLADSDIRLFEGRAEI